MNNRKLRTLVLSLSAIALFSCGSTSDKTSTGNGGGNPSASLPSSAGKTDKAVSKIERENAPAKTTYYYDEPLDLTGGTILVTYEDGTTESLPLTAEGVTVEGNTSKANSSTKTIIVRYGGKRTTFRITVGEQGFSVTFDLNYEGDSDIVVNVSKGSKAARPQDPTREGYTFYDWYKDSQCTVKFDFDTIISSDRTLYASWKNSSSYEVTYNLNYYGVNPDSYTQIVQSGEQPRTPSIDIARNEFSFKGWFTDAAATVSYANAPISQDRTLYAGWTKTKTGSSSYIFQAEETNRLGKVGPGFSGEAIGQDRIVTNAANVTYVSYLYKQGLSVDFYLASDRDAKATLSLSLAEEFSGITLTDQTWQIRRYSSKDSDSFVNVPYGSLTLNGSEFHEYLNVEVDLKKGYNLISLYTNNSVNPNGEGNGTFAGTAPNVDYLKLTTQAVVTWDGNYGLPFKY